MISLSNKFTAKCVFYFCLFIFYSKLIYIQCIFCLNYLCFNQFFLFINYHLILFWFICLKIAQHFLLYIHLVFRIYMGFNARICCCYKYLCVCARVFNMTLFRELIPFLILLYCSVFGNSSTEIC